MKGDYYHTKESVEEYINLAKDVNGKELIEKLAEYLAFNSTLLEIGTGPGSDWEILNKNYNAIGSDNSTEFIKHLIRTYPEGEFLELDAATLNTDRKYDGIYSNKVLHHLKDAELIHSILKQSEILNPNGIICHSFWKGEGTEIFKGLFVNYWNEENIKNLFQKYFDIILLEEYQEFEKNDSILLIAKKKYFTSENDNTQSV